MIALLITDNEDKVRNIFSRILQQEGYSASDWNKVVRITRKENSDENSFIKKLVVELHDSLSSEKKGNVHRAVLEAVEKPLIEHTLERTDGNQLKAAKILGINRNTMRAKIKRLGINTEIYKQLSA